MRLRILTLLLVTLALAACAAQPAAPTATLTVAAPTAAPTTPAALTSTPPPTSSPPATAVPTIASTPPTIEESALDFDGALALAHAEAQCAIGPRPVGSEALLQTRDYIERVLLENGWEVVRHDGEFMGVPIHNVIGVKGEGAAQMVGAHFDTRPVADMDPNAPAEPIIGGNDGASGVGVLLELARVLEVPEGRQVQLAFFDAEDRGNLEGWPFSVGARLVASEMPVQRPEAMVLLDMIGDADQQIYREQNSDDALTDTIFGIAAALGYEGNGFYNSDKYLITDDHLPFIEAGIPAIDLIDFDYPYWHTVEDTCDKLSAQSLMRVGRVIEAWLEGE